MRSKPEGELSVVVMDLLDFLWLRFMLPHGSESWVLEKYGRNFINGAPTTEERQTKNCPTQHIGWGTKATETASWLDDRERDFSAGLRQWQQLKSARERGKIWELAQRGINKKDKKNLTPLPVDPYKIYCNVTPVMFDCFVCALSFCAFKFPVKSETREPGKNIV